MPSVLYVDDNDDNVLLIQQLLRLRSHVELQVATSGAEGLKMAQDNTPDLILLDYRLPDLRGPQVIEKLRESPATAAIPVVLFTADPDIARRAVELGADGSLPKPFQLEQLLNLVDQYCSAAT